MHDADVENCVAMGAETCRLREGARDEGARAGMQTHDNQWCRGFCVDRFTYV